MTAQTNPVHENLHRLEGYLKIGLRKTGAFLAETPLTLIACAVVGVALLILYPQFAAPLLGLAAAAELTRLAVIVIDKLYPKLLHTAKEKIFHWAKKLPKVEYIALLIAMVLCLLHPLIGLAVSLGVGLYKGIIVEIDISKYTTELHRKKRQNPNHSGMRVTLW